MQGVFFGEDEQLFGIYHSPRGNPAPPVRAVVICPPIGQDYVRTHWCLRLLAQQLARKGMHVLRFDYFGIGDSKGDPADVKSVQHWEHDVEEAVTWLIESSGAQSCMLIGLRTGASLAARVAVRRSIVNSLVMWEPVQSGDNWLKTTRAMHAEMLDLWVCSMTTANDDQFEELLGTLYSRRFVNDFEQELVDFSQLNFPNLVVDVENRKSVYEHINNAMQKTIFTQDENSWEDLRQLETAWLRPQTTRLIVDQIEDIFERLLRFGVLQEEVEAVQ